MFVFIFTIQPCIKDGQPHVTWTERCRFALVIFSVVSDAPTPTKMEIDCDVTENNVDPSMRTDQVPWTFVHEER